MDVKNVAVSVESCLISMFTQTVARAWIGSPLIQAKAGEGATQASHGRPGWMRGRGTRPTSARRSNS